MMDINVEQWKMKRMIKDLENARGNGTSMISLVIRPKDEISRIGKKLGEEFGTAQNIKSRVNRLSVLSAISSAQQRLKLYNRTPPNGLVVYCGEVMTDDGKEKKLSIDMEPFKPVNTSLYHCDNKFHVEPLKELLESDDVFGFIVTDGNGAGHREVCFRSRRNRQRPGDGRGEKADCLGSTGDQTLFDAQSEHIRGNSGVLLPRSPSQPETIHRRKDGHRTGSGGQAADDGLDCGNYTKYGAELEFVSNRSQEGSQFERGFGGLGGILRYKIEVETYDEIVSDNEDFI
eukprot:Selendium_serpulae@DN6466_c1_g1_i3.p2